MPDKEKFQRFMQIFLCENSKLNLISKNDEKYLWEKHICDSLALEMFFNKYGMGKTLLDIGTGGGFPAVPIALEYPQLKVFALDSISKKIRAVQNIKDKLHLDNLTCICARAETVSEKFDIVTSRAVSSLKNICAYALPKIHKDGYFVAYKSIKVQDEINDAKVVLKKFNAEIADIIKYNLQADEVLSRNLVVIKIR